MLALKGGLKNLSGNPSGEKEEFPIGKKTDAPHQWPENSSAGTGFLPGTNQSCDLE